MVKVEVRFCDVNFQILEKLNINVRFRANLDFVPKKAAELLKNAIRHDCCDEPFRELVPGLTATQANPHRRFIVHHHQFSTKTTLKRSNRKQKLEDKNKEGTKPQREANFEYQIPSLLCWTWSFLLSLLQK